jgi:osmotically-inducible protein OsmY
MAMTALLTKADHDIQLAVRDELDWIPELFDAPRIAVGVSKGVVTLTGLVETHLQRVAAKRAAFRVHGVHAVVDRVEIMRAPGDLSDPEIATAVRNAVEWASDLPPGIHTSVHDGIATLTGEVQWEHQRRRAQDTVEWVKGVRSVDNRLTLARRPSGPDTRERIHHALVRNAIIDANAIDVEIDGTTVVLCGTVRTWLEKAQASRTAWSSPHVTEVDNRIIVKAD